MHESRSHDRNCFLTLTYDDQHLPEDFSLHYEHFQLFMKRLRKEFDGKTVRFYMCGEYGETNHRPHYHACIFGIDFPDKRLWRPSKSGFNLYRSALLERLWPWGFSTIGDLTFETAAYTARYIMKKVTGDRAAKHYEVIESSTGEVHSRVPEFTRMSLKPGIGANWMDEFHSDVYPRDKVISRGVPSKPPRYYDKRFKQIDEAEYDLMKMKRIKQANLNAEDNTPDRLAVKEVVAKAKISTLKRGFS